MTEEQMKFIPYEMALKIVGNVIEEEHLHELNRRVLTVYDKNGKELCWYDADDVLAEVSGPDAESRKLAAVDHIMHQIPEWAVDDLLASVEKKEG
jgi:hypothetical protein